MDHLLYSGHIIPIMMAYPVVAGGTRRKGIMICPSVFIRKAHKSKIKAKGNCAFSACYKSRKMNCFG
ncbi:hypothetical protein MYP_1433 [Sporocytophaga myxococcoides]|uniref:Uncharacterized protein n=1 Tax=Sporocytophaga myxococcoides TaxID=153721 RepID=A0A098LBA6_9BACT|nr:hypothetical protein MYP_1433 [Sporocytophaga myxococcoides]